MMTHPTLSALAEKHRSPEARGKRKGNERMAENGIGTKGKKRQSKSKHEGKKKEIDPTPIQPSHRHEAAKTVNSIKTTSLPPAQHPQKPPKSLAKIKKATKKRTSQTKRKSTHHSHSLPTPIPQNTNRPPNRTRRRRKRGRRHRSLDRSRT